MNKVLIIFVLLTLTMPSMAYIDPGSGSAIMSAIIGFFVAVGLAIKTYWYKIKSFLGLSKKTENPDTSSDND
ncbi:MAG: hypothetical protein L3J53_02290 [Proteobacteria bacterium]|nr:hypothetical protein [Pseudomonadota bacterium]